MVSDCYHLLVFAAWDQYTPERINDVFDLVNEERGFKNEGFQHELQVDSVPMEGFEPKAVDEIEASNDWLVNLKKVRRPKDKFIIEAK